MKKISSFFILVLLGCSSVINNNELFLFNNISFKINHDEKIVDVTPNLTVKYFNYVKNSHLQIPLLKVINGRDYTIFLGIPYNTSLKKLTQIQLLQNSTDSILFQSDSSSYYFKKQNNDSIFIAEYSRIFDKNIIYILAETRSKLIADSLFNQTQFSNRFNINK
jgi:hypothetical protein